MTAAVAGGAGADFARFDDGNFQTGTRQKQRGCHAGDAASDDCHIDGDICDRLGKVGFGSCDAPDGAGWLGKVICVFFP